MKRLRFMYLNTRSLFLKLNELRTLITKAKVAVISITETWLDQSITNQKVEISSYKIVQHDRNHELGGICVYIWSHIAFNTIHDIVDDPDLSKTKPQRLAYAITHESSWHCSTCFRNHVWIVKIYQIRNAYYLVILIQCTNKLITIQTTTLWLSG